MGYEQLPPEVTMWRQDRACKNCEKLETRIKVLEEDLSDMFNVGPVCLECQRKDERIEVLEGALPPPERLELLALVFDAYDALTGAKGKEVQNDLRLWATRIRKALEVK
jgi:hypothetical protein